jgi:hypothetical protein
LGVSASHVQQIVELHATYANVACENDYTETLIPTYMFEHKLSNSQEKINQTV